MGIGEGNNKKYHIYLHNIKDGKRIEGEIMKKKETYKHGGYG